MLSGTHDVFLRLKPEPISTTKRLARQLKKCSSRDPYDPADAVTDYPKAGGFYASSSIAAGIKRPARVFDGVWPHVTGAGRLALNLRLAQPDCYPRQHEHHLYPSDQFPFA